MLLVVYGYFFAYLTIRTVCNFVQTHSKRTVYMYYGSRVVHIVQRLYSKWSNHLHTLYEWIEANLSCLTFYLTLAWPLDDVAEPNQWPKQQIQQQTGRQRSRRGLEYRAPPRYWCSNLLNQSSNWQGWKQSDRYCSQRQRSGTLHHSWWGRMQPKSIIVQSNCEPSSTLRNSHLSIGATRECPVLFADTREQSTMMHKPWIIASLVER